MGLMENQVPENINEVSSLRSKSYSIQKVSELNVNNYKLRKSKGINKNYCKVNHNHEYFKKILFNDLKTTKASYYKL